MNKPSQPTEPTLFQCHTCRFEWRQGMSGAHDCSVLLSQRVEELRIEQERWQDPAFDPTQPAVYYLRVLEVETPRWTTLLADRFGLDRPTLSTAMIRERAWSSPIWYRAR